MSETIALLYMAAIFVAIVIAILWVLLPFAVFGIKDRLDTLLEVERKQLEELHAMRRLLDQRDTETKTDESR